MTKFIKLTEWSQSRNPIHTTHNRPIYINLEHVCSINRYSRTFAAYEYFDEGTRANSLGKVTEDVTCLAYPAAAGDDTLADLVHETPEEIFKLWKEAQ